MSVWYSVMMLLCPKRPFLILTIGGVTMMFAILVQHFIFPNAVYLYIRKTLYLRPGSEMWDIFEEVPFPVHMHYYLFNVSNPDEIQNQGAKPVLQEMGRYTYLEKFKKHNITFNDDGTISYYQSKTYHFLPEMSNGTEDDLITLINVPFMGAAPYFQQVAGWKLSAPFVNMIIRGFDERLFITKSVRELIFGGYHEPLLAQAQLLGAMTILKDNKFGFFNTKNATKDGPFTVHSGNRDITHMFHIQDYKGSRFTHKWNGTCDMINGTDGTMFAPFLTRDQKVHLFETDACRSVHLTYEKDASYAGIPTYRYTLPGSIWDSATDNPDNACFCQTPNNVENCPPRGLIDITNCRGIESYISNPHFLDSDPSLQNGVEGLHPDEDKHKTFAEIEPVLGVIVKARKSIQLNVQLKPHMDLADLRKVREVVFPVLWFSEEVLLSDQYVDLVHRKWVLPNTIMTCLYWIILVIGAATLACGIAVWRIQSNTRLNEKAFPAGMYKYLPAPFVITTKE